MRVGVDTNVLITAALPGLRGHVRVRRALTELLESNALVALTPEILHELVHIVTDGRRFDQPLSMGEALALARVYLHRSNVELLSTDEVATSLAFSWMEQHGLGRKRLADTLLAATLVAHEVTSLLTLNARDFRVFPALSVIDPLD